MGEQIDTLRTEELLDEVIARNEASIDRIHTRIEELREFLARLSQDSVVPCATT